MINKTEQCKVLTNHAQLGETGACSCGAKKYKTEPTGPYRCPFCDKQPEVIPPTPSAVDTPLSELETYCATEGCPAFSITVPLSRWNKRAPHEQEVARIPTDEPIFILRAKDAFAIVPVWHWIDMADKKRGPQGERVPDEKIEAAMDRAGQMQKFQETNGNKIAD